MPCHQILNYPDLEECDVEQCSSSQTLQGPVHEWLAGVGRGGDHDPGGTNGGDHHDVGHQPPERRAGDDELSADTEHDGRAVDNDGGKHLPHAPPGPLQPHRHPLEKVVDGEAKDHQESAEAGQHLPPSPRLLLPAAAALLHRVAVSRGNIARKSLSWWRV